MRVIDLDGPDGNAFFLLGQASQWAKDLDLDPSPILEEMKQGDYNHLCKTFIKHFGLIARLETTNPELALDIFDEIELDNTKYVGVE